MAFRLFTCLLLAAAVEAGPVGTYLGFQVDKQQTSTATGKDSIHFLVGGDSIFYRSSFDTVTIVSETTRLGQPAWVLLRATNSRSVSDTVWEQGDSFLMGRQAVLDTVFTTPAYLVPFAIGRAWRMGLAGIHYLDLNGDTLLDTLTIWADSCLVAGRDSVSVPYGDVPGCWRIERTMRQALALMQDTLPVRETSFIRSVEWYKDSLWSVKESTCITGRIYMKLFIWLPLADFHSRTVSVLTGLRSPIAGPETPPATRPSLSATIVRGVLLLPGTDAQHSDVELLNAAGRCVLTRRLERSSAGSFSIDVRALAPGLYFLRSSNPALTRKVLILI